MSVAIVRASSIAGSAFPPSSKSAGHRALICAALAALQNRDTGASCRIARLREPESAVLSAVKPRDNGNKLINLLDEYGLTSRIIKDFDGIADVLSKDIDYSEVNNELQRRREDAMSFLDEMVKGI